MKKISILVSTVDLNFLSNPNFSKNIDFDICEVVIVQQKINDNRNLEVDFSAKIISVNEKGLSKSRNLALANANAPIALICDDDVAFVKGFEEKIIEAHYNNKNAALISFQIENNEGKLYKNYPKKKILHNFRSIFRVNSIEISIKITLFSKRNLFDENFGLGASCPTGEDTIFAIETYKSGKECLFIPQTIVIHPLESSGKTFNEKYPFYRGQLYRRAFSEIGLLMGLFFGIKKYNLYKSSFSFFYFFENFIKGYFTKVK